MAFLRGKIAELRGVETVMEEQIQTTTTSLAEAKTTLNQKKITKEEILLDQCACMETLVSLQKKHR